MTRLLTPDQAAEILQVSKKTLHRLRGEGLTCVAISGGTIRYRADDLDSFIQSRATPCRSAPS